MAKSPVDDLSRPIPDIKDAPAPGKAAEKAARLRREAMAADPGPRPRGAGSDFGTVPFALKRHVSPHGQVTAVSMMKDEGPFVLEWVAHHLMLGFTDLVVYTNDCSDGTDDMLIRLEALGLVHHRRNVIPEGQRPQPSALNHAEAEPVVRLSDWVMVFDADEFLSIRHGDGRLDGMIAEAVEKGANGIVVTWRIFGSGGVVDWSRAPVTEQYLQAAPMEWNKGWGVKTLFKFDPDAWKLGIHRPKLKTKVIKTGFPDTVKWLNGSGQPMEDYFTFRGWRSITRTVGYDWVQLNHYAVKSVDSYALRKLRGNVNNKKDKYNSDYWSLQDRNEVRDETMLRYSEARDQLIATLLTDPELKRLHEAALARVEARLAEIRETPDYAALVADLGKASAVPIGQIVAKPPQARDPAKIAALMSDVEKLRNAKAKAERKATGPGDTPPMVAHALYTDHPAPKPDFTGDWVANHKILLPCDPGVFAGSTLPVIAKGKFDRALARVLPQDLLQGGRVLEIGSGCGFLTLHLAQTRPDLALVQQEDDPGLREAMAVILTRNPSVSLERLDFDPAPLSDLKGMVTRHRPDVLILADPRLPPAPLDGLPSQAWPARILLHSRLMEALGNPGPQKAQAWLGAADYAQNPRFDSNQTLGFDRI